MTSMQTTADAKKTITHLDRANSQLQMLFFSILFLFASCEQEPACHTRNHLYQWKWPTVSIATAEMHHSEPHRAPIPCLVSRNIHQVSVHAMHAIFSMWKNSVTQEFMLQTHFQVGHHFVRVPLCCHLSQSNKMYQKISGKVQHLLLYHQYPPLTLRANRIK